MKSPSEELFELIFPILVEEKLMLELDLKSYREKIVGGNMKSEDWLLAVEKAIDKEKIKVGV